MSESCPTNTVDERAARVVAGIVTALAIVSSWTPATWLIALLAIDFAIRAWIGRRYSPLRWVAKRITGVLGWSPKPVYAPPKQFAARIGSVLTAAATVAHLAGIHALGVGLTGALVVAASLEAAAGFCIACWVYPLVFKVRGAASQSSHSYHQATP